MRHYSFHSLFGTVLSKHGISSTASNVKALTSLREITWHRYDWQRVNYYQDLHLTSDEVELLKDACELGLCFSMTNRGITEILIETKVKNILDEINYTIACLEEEDKPIQELGIDIETYSSNDLPGCGVYKYVEADDFQILLFAYSINNGPVHMVDLACGEELPSKVKEALTDPAVLKTAYNAAFERICLSRWLGMPTGEYLAPEQWDCTMVRAARLGMPMSLDKCGQVLGIERPKMKEGAALIRYFSIPCKQTKANGGRTRNLPGHAPEKWATFKAYCIRDVEAEQQIRDRVKRKPVTDKETRLWFIDQHINDRGVLIDLKLARNAADMDTEAKERLFQEAQEITGLANPNSVAQLKEFIERKEGHKIPAVRKEEIKELIKTCKNSDVRRVLEIRLELGKTSNNKYQTMLDCACDDCRVRGITQFYGAARTGRWAGRLLQTQNLPQNHIPDLDYARSLVLNGDYDDVDLMYGNVTQTLSELIRTALIAKSGTTFHVCDFSAIECRVLAWLAGEEWVLDNFRKGGDIYCATASQMFHVPVEKHGQNAELRQKGKVATLACGYGGGQGALAQMGGARMGMTEQEMKDTVKQWRAANPHIVKFWANVERACIYAVTNETECELKSAGLKFSYKWGGLAITLPSGRFIYYPHMRKEPDAVLSYEGMNQVTKKWERVDTYGGKITENITQAVARDCLAEVMHTMSDKGIQMVFHVHDEIISECDPSVTSLQDIETYFGMEILWAKGLPLKGAGYTTNYYKKD